MREFRLKNARGDEWNLTEEKSFLASPKISAERKIAYMQIGSISIKTEDVLKQKSIPAKIVFGGYEIYDGFCRFIQHRPLELVYTAADTYRMKVEIEKLTKTELDNAGLTVDITMKGLTTWYKSVFQENMQPAGGKVYTYTYPYTYSDNTQGSIEFECDSVEASPIRLNIMGPCENPAWELYVNGIKSASGKVLCSISEGHRLVVDATQIPYELAEYDGSGAFVQSLYQLSDFSTQRFLQAGFGKNRVACRHDGTAPIKVAAEVRIEHAAV